MASKTLNLSFFLIPIFFSCQLNSAGAAETWVKAGYWYASGELPSRDIDSTLFTHLLYAFANVNNSTFQLSSAGSEELMTSFAANIKRRNPQVKAMMSIWNGIAATGNSISGLKVDYSVLSSVISNNSSRKLFIDSSIRTARLHGFDGIDLFWLWPNGTDLTRIGILFQEWRAAIASERRNSDQAQLILTMAVRYVPEIDSVTYPIELISKNVDWAHVVAYDYHLPTRENFTGFHAALYNPSSNITTDFGITRWLNQGFPAEKLVLGLPFHGYAWKLLSSQENFVGARASGPAITTDGSIGYKAMKSYIRDYGYGTAAVYNGTYVSNVFTLATAWVDFDGVETVRAKISYARKKGLIGYNAFQLSNDDNWELCLAAQGGKRSNKHWLLLIVLLPLCLVVITTVAALVYYCRGRVIKSEEEMALETVSPRTTRAAAVTFGSDAPHLQVFSFKDIQASTNNFSNENKLGEGGYGPVYKGILPMGLQVAVKRLSATSAQGNEEFQNEVTLTARLQHVNLVRVLGYCTEMEEKLLIYEYMPNKSLELYLFDPIRRFTLDWRKRVQIIEGITQGLLYLQEYSNVTVIHRDLKASNILLDSDMNPKISDFGMAKLFKKDTFEANTGRIVGTYGFVPPEYVRKGIYSMKYDVYSFGVLLLQIISGKRTTGNYGPRESISLMEFAYQSWNYDNISDFADTCLDDSSSPCKVARCLQIALLCIQEEPEDRPTMLEVFSMLKNDSVAIATPKQPAFSLKEGKTSASTSTSQQEIYSYNSQISQVEPR